jgi:hypothetical protein
MLHFLTVLHFLHKLCCLTQIFSLFDDEAVAVRALRGKHCEFEAGGQGIKHVSHNSSSHTVRQVSSGEWFLLRGLSV